MISDFRFDFSINNLVQEHLYSYGDGKERLRNGKPSQQELGPQGVSVNAMNTKNVECHGMPWTQNQN